MTVLLVVEDSRRNTERFQGVSILLSPGLCLTLRPVVCGGEMTAPTGVIHSPNYPKNYERNTTCEWSISVEENYAVVLTFEDVDMYRSNCSDNYIKIFDGPTAAYPVLQEICGDAPNNSIVSSTNNMFIEMKGSHHFPTKGFLAKYRTVREKLLFVLHKQVCDALCVELRSNYQNAGQRTN